MACTLACMMLTAMVSCNNDDRVDGPVQTESTSDGRPMGFVDQSWSPGALLYTGLLSPVDTNMMYGELQKIAAFWGQPAPVMRFVNDPSDPSAKANINARSYQQGYIYYGFPLYYKAKSEAGDIANIGILVHEYGHQLQFKFNLSAEATSQREKELEADGFSGYYLGNNRANFQQVAAITNFIFQFGDAQPNMPDSHGTGAQRRSAIRLGYILGQNPAKLSAQQFDRYFFYYYNGVLSGTYRNTSDFTPDPSIDRHVGGYLDELHKIRTGEISEKEYLLLK